MAAIGAKKMEHEECEQQQPQSRRAVKDNNRRKTIKKMKNQQTRKKTIIIYHVIKPKVEILIQINYKEPRKGIIHMTGLSWYYHQNWLI